MNSKILFAILSLAVLACNSPKEDKAKKEVKQEVQKEIKKEVVVKKVVKKGPKNQKLTLEQQIASALLAAPMQAREEATVYGYDGDGDLVVIRDGENNFICLADNPNKDGFEVVSYHSSLEPYMAMGRALTEEGKTRQEKEAARESEAQSGKLVMPENPATLHIYYGKEGFFDTESGLIENAKYRYVVYIPYATQETTGLPEKPNASNHPWLMFPGKYNAHIMISPTN